MPDQPLVAARYLDKEGKVRLTESTSIEALLREAQARIPCDIVYVLTPHSDGLGYTYREVGALSVTIQPITRDASHDISSPPPAPLPSLPETAYTYFPGESGEAITPIQKDLTTSLSEPINTKPLRPRKVKKPQLTRGRGKLVVTATTEATPAEAAAASMIKGH